MTRIVRVVTCEMTEMLWIWSKIYKTFNMRCPSFDVVASDRHLSSRPSSSLSVPTHILDCARVHWIHVSAELEHISSWALQPLLNSIPTSLRRCLSTDDQDLNRLIPWRESSMLRSWRSSGVKLSEDLNAATHISESCSRSVYTLCILQWCQSHSLHKTALHEVARATT